jgi:hypothetical protein
MLTQEVRAQFAGDASPHLAPEPLVVLEVELEEQADYVR